VAGRAGDALRLDSSSARWTCLRSVGCFTAARNCGKAHAGPHEVG
jgi:hypothetical protein